MIDLNFEYEKPKQSITPSISFYDGSSENFKHLINNDVDDFHISDLDVDSQQLKMTTINVEKLPPRKYFNFINAEA